MADRLKSNNYWCKHCKTFVRDTPLEKRNHEATPRHQGALQRFLKDLHRTNERENREAQRGKDEVTRLNGLKPGVSKDAPPRTTQRSAGSGGASGPPRQATEAERKQQMAQLAAMGVVVPDEFRKENAMAGEWEATPVHPAARPPPLPLPLASASRIKKEEAEEESKMPEVEVDMERKRKLNEVDGDSHGTGNLKRRPNWGSDVRVHKDLAADVDLDNLLADSTVAIGKSVKKQRGEDDRKPSDVEEPKGQEPTIKKEEYEEASVPVEVQGPYSSSALTANLKDEDEEGADLGMMFKKRKKRGVV